MSKRGIIMTKRVILTWMDGTEKVTEECLLVSETDSIRFINDEDQFVLETHDLISLLMDSEMVIFLDEDGLFGLPPEQIIKIEDVTDEST